MRLVHIRWCPHGIFVQNSDKKNSVGGIYHIMEIYRLDIHSSRRG